MAEDVVVLQEHKKDSISSLPRTYLEALSAIQEQSFVEAGLDDPEEYSQAFTFKHRLAFFRVGFHTAFDDALLAIVGMILYVIAKKGGLPIFSYWHLTKFNLFYAFTVATLPYMATFLLTLDSLLKVTGTISRNMVFHLILGFTQGAILTTMLTFVLGYGLSQKFAMKIYSSLMLIEQTFHLDGMANYFWQYVRPAITLGTWNELKAAMGISAAMFLVYFFKVFKKRQH